MRTCLLVTIYKYSVFLDSGDRNKDFIIGVGDEFTDTNFVPANFQVTISHLFFHPIQTCEFSMFKKNQICYTCLNPSCSSQAETISGVAAKPYPIFTLHRVQFGTRKL